MPSIFHGDCLDLLDLIPRVPLIFMDPPDNLGLSYNGYLDKRVDYYQWLELVVRKALPKAKTLWLSYYWSHDLEIKYFIRQIIKHNHRSLGAKTFLWRYTFGQYLDTDCGSGFRFLLRLTFPDCALNVNSIRVESERMKLGDKRAAGPRVPDDVWEIPRVVGNSPERRTWHPTQHPDYLYQRIINMSSNPGDTCVDLFGGTGTMLRNCRLLNREAVISEISQEYCEILHRENPEATDFN